MEREWPWLSPSEPGWNYGVVRRLYLDMCGKDLEGADAAWLVRAALDGAGNVRDIVEDDIGYLVAEARARGVTWEKIGEDLERSKQSAQEKYGKGLSANALNSLDAEVSEALAEARATLADPGASPYDHAEAKDVIDRFGEPRTA